MTNRTAAAAFALLAAGAWGQCEQGWDERFGPAVVRYPPHSMAAAELDGERVLFTVGDMESATYSRDGGGVARWDGAAWTQAPDGLESSWPSHTRFVRSPATGAVYAYRGQLTLDGKQLGTMARWDGRTWEAVETPHGADLLAVGDSDGAELLAVVGHGPSGGPDPIVVRDENGWHTIGTIEDGRDIRAMLWADLGAGPHLYAFGRFEEIAGQPLLHAAEWDGQAWHPLGDGLAPYIDEAVVFDLGNGPGLFAYDGYSGWFFSGGNWTRASDDTWPWTMTLLGRHDLLGRDVLLFEHPEQGHAPPFGLRAWDGHDWTMLPGEFNDDVLDAGVYDIGGDAGLYVCGAFTAIDDQPAIGIARFDGARWRPVGNAKPTDGLWGIRSMLAVGEEGGPLLGNRLYAAGDLLRGWEEMGPVAAWDGVRWEKIAPPPMRWDNPLWFTYTVRLADLGDGPRILLAGELVNAQYDPTPVLQWDGVSWSTVGEIGQLSGWATSLMMFDDGSGERLYASGDLVIDGSVPASIARFEGGRWEPYLVITPGAVYDLEVYNDGGGQTLYAAVAGGADFGAGLIGPVIKHADDGWELAGNNLYYFMSDHVGSGARLEVIEVGGRRLLTVFGDFYVDDSEIFDVEQLAVLDGGVWHKDLDYMPYHPYWLTTSVARDGRLITFINNSRSSEPDVAVCDGDVWHPMPGELDYGANAVAMGTVGGSESVFLAGPTSVDGIPSDGFARYGCPHCPADFDADGDADEADFVEFMGLWEIGDTAADLDLDGYTDTRDVIGFLNHWNAGC
ncbi:MAG: hypothetical protein IT431_04145 [Phycisphaerales bacterium]|nr:hypothetical protein [Phycisphaerales bacterium]